MSPVALPAPPSRHLIGLDLLRIFSALAVLLFHLVFWFRFGEPLHRGFGGFPLDYDGVAPLFWFGWVGVEIFFVVSGFVICASAAHGDPARFLRGRVLRLVPGVWICSSLTLCTVAAFGFGPFDAVTCLRLWLKALTLVPAEPLLDPSLWTLGVEVVFYALVLLLLASGGFPVVRRGVLAVALVSCLFWLGQAVPVDLVSAGFAGLGRRSEELLLLRHGCFFGLGMILYLRLVAHRSCPWHGALALLCLASCLLEIRATADGVAPFVPAATSWSVPALVWLAGIAVIPLSLRARSAPSGRGRLVRAIRQAGLATFPLYLLHQIIGYTILHGLHGRLPDTALLIAVLGLMPALALFVSLTAEPRLRAGLATIGRRASGRHRPVAFRV